MSRLSRRRAGIVVAGVVAFTVAVPAAGFAVTTFTDVPAASSYKPDITAATSAGVLSQCAAGKFCPKATVTREQLARAVNRLGALGPGTRPVAHALTAVAAQRATKALTATNAGHATTADSATTATTATTADSAANAANAGTLDGIDSTGFVPRSGQVLVNAGDSNWHPFNSTDDVTATYYSSQTQWFKPVVGSNFLSIQPDVPVVMNGTSLELTGVQLCYSTFAGTSLKYVEVNTLTSTVDAGSRAMRLSDSTQRTDAACRLYSLPAPIAVTGTDDVNLFIQVGWTVAGATFAIGRTTFIFNATSTPAAAPLGSPASGATTVLKPGGLSTEP
jgi:hypothetical protein